MLTGLAGRVGGVRRPGREFGSPRRAVKPIRSTSGMGDRLPDRLDSRLRLAGPRPRLRGRGRVRSAGGRVLRIAAAARCNKALIYAYFDSKDALFDAAFAAHVQAHLDRVNFDGTDLPAYAGRLFDIFEDDQPSSDWPPGTGSSAPTARDSLP
jgi:Bacterial regulatory proteins, tetR family